MKYDFTSIIDRHGRDALAVDGLGQPGCPPSPPDGVDAIPMWIADMNFAAVPTIPAAIIERAQHPLFGYFDPRGEYYAAIVAWQEERNGVSGLRPEHIGYENGVLGGVIAALNTFCARGSAVLVHSPTYIGFTHSMENCGYRLVHSPLRLDENGVYRMDFADMERKIIERHIHAMVFCSPHNPTGRVWERWELEALAALCEKHDVKIVSDEIWSDILRPGVRHIPTQSAGDWARENTIAMYAPSKTFNLAGLIGSYHIVYNRTLRERMEKEASLIPYNHMNLFSMYALLGAYTPEGREWCDELCETIAGNIDWACEYIAAHFPGVRVSKPQGTYMLFLDCTGWCAAHGRTLDELLEAGWRAGVIWQDGRPFHGACHIRMNLALPLSRVQEAFRRLDEQAFNA